MKSAAVVFAVLLATTGVGAQQRREHAGPPPAPFVPQTLSTGGITTLPPPPPPSPFAAQPDTYAPRYDRPFRAGPGRGVSIYNGTLGVGLYALPMPTPSVPARTPTPDAPVPEPPPIQEPPNAAPPPPAVAQVNGPDTFYVIPGCYAGNRPPLPARLPAGCDVSKTRTLPIR